MNNKNPLLDNIIQKLKTWDFIQNNLIEYNSIDDAPLFFNEAWEKKALSLCS